MYLNNESVSLELDDDFKIYDYKNHIMKISDLDSDIEISTILISNTKINKEIVSDLFYDGTNSF